MTRCPAMPTSDDILPGLRPLLIFPGVTITKTIAAIDGQGLKWVWMLHLTELARCTIAEAMNVKAVDVETKVSERIVANEPLFQHTVKTG